MNGSKQNTIHDEIIIFLRRCSVFAGLSEKQLRIVVGLVTEVTIAGNEYIIQEGQVGEAFYIIKDGEAEIDRYDEEWRCCINCNLSSPRRRGSTHANPVISISNEHGCSLKAA